jgi:hypothetical protein
MIGFFKTNRKIATAAGIDAVRPMVASIQHSHGLPSGFWTDPYILGFFSFTIAHHAKLATRGSIENHTLDLVLGDVLASVSNLNGSALVERTGKLSPHEDTDFNRGADDAAVICFYTIKALKNEKENALVVRASNIAARSTEAGNTDAERRAYIASLMFMLTLMNELDRM